MKIYAKCEKCRAELESNTSCDTRVQYVMKKGDYVEQRCTTCNHDNRLHIDEYKTRQSKSIKKTALLVLLVGLVISLTTFLWLYYIKQVILIAYGLFGIPFFLYGAIVKYDQSRVANFNRHKVRG